MAGPSSRPSMTAMRAGLKRPVRFGQHTITVIAYDTPPRMRGKDWNTGLTNQLSFKQPVPDLRFFKIVFMDGRDNGPGMTSIMCSRQAKRFGKIGDGRMTYSFLCPLSAGLFGRPDLRTVDNSAHAQFLIATAIRLFIMLH